MAKITIVGMYNLNNKLFDSLVLPEGIDKDTIVSEILRRCCEFELLIPDMEYLTFFIGSWSAKMTEVWTSMIKTRTSIKEPWDKETRTVNITRKNNVTSNESVESSDTRTSTGNSDNTSTEKVSGFNSNTLVPNKEVGNDYNETLNVKNTGNNTKESTDKEDGTENVEETVNRQTDVVETARKYYDFININIYDIIVESFKHEFCVCVY